MTSARQNGWQISAPCQLQALCFGNFSALFGKPAPHLFTDDQPMRPVTQDRNRTAKPLQLAFRNRHTRGGNQKHPRNTVRLGRGICSDNTPAHRIPHKRNIFLNLQKCQQLIQLLHIEIQCVTPKRGIRIPAPIKVVTQHAKPQRGQRRRDRIPHNRWRRQPMNRHDDRPARTTRPTVMRLTIRQFGEITGRSLAIPPIHRTTLPFL